MSSEMIAAGDASVDPALALGYASKKNQRDEAVSPSGTVEPEWYNLFESINRNGAEGLSTWRNAAARVSRERGLAYRMESFDEDPEEGWTLDPVPWVISSEKWAENEAGIAQRIRLYEALLKDIYGPQNSVKERLFPAEILFSHRGFLRALHNLPPGNGVVGLGLSAFDIARDSGGQAFVLRDRFDCPFGPGLALENRTVINKVLPRLFGRCGVRRIGQFYTDWFDYLGSCAPPGVDSPQVVILDGSERGGESEIGFLSNYCGVTRVHSSDLTVRDGRVWIKALNGLVPVDVIWKNMAGRDIDSLESENSFATGTAGLFESIRAGGVSVVSHPGSEVLQSPGLYPYLPSLCKTFLDEDLLIPPVATWWCGKPEALSYVLENLSTMVVKPSGYHLDFPTQYGSRLSHSELEVLKAQISSDPPRYVGQEELTISTVPTTRPGGLVPRGAVLRMFAFADRDMVPRIMPGGLGRVSPADGSIISTRKWGESKDVWICSENEEKAFHIASALSLNQQATADIVPSRTGENLFWTGRYAERTDFISRIAARTIDLQIRGGSPVDGFGQRHENLLLGALFKIFKCPEPLVDETDTRSRLERILRDQVCPVGVTCNLERFYNATQVTREEWSPASTLAITSCYENWRTNRGSNELITEFDYKLDTLQLNLAAFLGLNLDSMTRDEGWALLDAGRRLERSFIVCGLLQYLLNTKPEEEMSILFNESILYSLDSVRTFQSLFHKAPSTDRILRLLLCETDYPRSVSHLLERLDRVLKKLPPPEHRQHPRVLIGPWIIKMSHFHREITEGNPDRPKVIHFLEDMQRFLQSLSDAITVSYFSHAGERE